LCTPEGFTWASSIYRGTGPTLGTLDKPGTVVVNLADSLLDEGRLIITDNFYTSAPLVYYNNTIIQNRESMFQIN